MKKIIYFIPLGLLIITSCFCFYQHNKIKELNSNIKNYKTQIKNQDFNSSNKNIENITINTEKTCEYTETFTFIDYYENEKLFGTSGTTTLILEKFQSKTGPIIEQINNSLFNIDFIKDKNYEITYKKTIDYSKGYLNEYNQIIKIIPTDKEGLSQTQETCILN